MSVSFNARFLVTISSGQTNSAVINSSSYHDAAAIMLLGPGTLPENVKIQVNPSQDAINSSSDWCDLVDYAGNVITAPGQSQAKWYPELPTAPSFRLVSTSGAVAADRTFFAAKIFTTE
jgi:hypothetical protein